MILSALNSYYERLLERGVEGIAPFGFSREKISYALILTDNGSLVDVRDIRDTSGKKPVPSTLTVPQPPKRSVNISPCFLWDKSSYVLGVTAAEDEKSQQRAIKAHQAFKDMHLELLQGSEDKGLKALLAFLDWWRPEQFRELSIFSESMREANFVFKLEEDDRQYLHERDAAKEIRQEMLKDDDSPTELCLVTGERAPVATLHPAIKGVNGAQSSGASIVSFNLDAFTSYGKSQGHNSPVSEQATFAYTTVLNHLLRRGSRQCLLLGDTTLIFWAEAGTEEKVEAAELLFADLLNPPATDASESEKLRPKLEELAKGRPLRELESDLESDTKLYILGLAPNASRLSVRFWETGSLKTFADRLTQHYRDLLLQPLPWKTAPSIWRLLLQTVPQREGSKSKPEDMPPQLAGEMTRAILTGARYPYSMLSNLIMRMRADGNLSPLRVALCKAVLVRDARIANNTVNKEIPMSLDTESTEPGYLLGRLFAALENVQSSALGEKVNATIRDRYYGAASATPAGIFPVLIRNTQHHLSRLRKDKPGVAINLEKQINEIVGKLPASFPKSLRIEAQGRFAIGYYHQKSARFKRKESTIEEGED